MLTKLTDILPHPRLGQMPPGIAIDYLEHPTIEILQEQPLYSPKFFIYQSWWDRIVSFVKSLWRRMVK